MLYRATQIRSHFKIAAAPGKPGRFLFTQSPQTRQTVENLAFLTILRNLQLLLKSLYVPGAVCKPSLCCQCKQITTNKTKSYEHVKQQSSISNRRFKRDWCSGSKKNSQRRCKSYHQLCRLKR